MLFISMMLLGKDWLITIISDYFGRKVIVLIINGLAVLFYKLLSTSLVQRIGEYWFVEETDEGEPNDANNKQVNEYRDE